MSPRFPKFLFTLLLLFTGFLLQAQEKDRLHKNLKALDTVTSDTLRIKLLDEVGWDTSYENLAVGLKYSQEALTLAEKIKYNRGIIHACNTIGTIYQDMGDATKAIAFHLRSMELAEKNNEKLSIVKSCENISIVYSSQGNQKEAIRYLLRAKGISEELKDTLSMSAVLGNLGAAYLHFPDSIHKAVEVYDRALKLAEAQNNIYEIGNTMGGMSRAYLSIGDSAKSDLYMQRALKIMDSLKIYYSYSQLILNYASMLNERGHYAKAEKLLLEALAIFRNIGMAEGEKEMWEGLADVYQNSGQLQKSIDALKRHMKMKDSLINEDALRHQHELETLYQTEKTKNENDALKRKATLSNTILTSLIVGCFLLLIILFVLYNRSQLRKRSNEQLEKQNAIIEEKNKDITDSINYAKRIQDAILPSTTLLKKQFSDAFVFYRPRDIVSGDFWWCTEKNGKFLVAAADCTGHGVPGGFMSVMSAAFLSEIINEKGITSPAEILGLLRQKVITSLKQAHEKNVDSSEVKDGMDISLASFSSGNTKFELACANNPVWRIRNRELKVFNPDKFPVGIHHNELQPFTPQSDELQPGDMIYLFSDGYADQFGGKDGKKFKYKQLRDELLASSNFTCDQQGKIMEKKFDEWRGANEQVDDVLLIGIRI